MPCSPSQELFNGFKDCFVKVKGEGMGRGMSHLPAKLLEDREMSLEPHFPVVSMVGQSRFCSASDLASTLAAISSR